MIKELLKKENLLQAVELGNTDSSLLNKQVQHIHHNSKEVSAQTLYICKGLNYKSEYLEEAIHNGAMVYVAEKENVSNVSFPHIIVNDIRKALAAIACMYYNFPATKINMIGLTGTKGKSTSAYYIKSILDHFMKRQNLPDTAIVSSIDTYDGKTCKESLITSPESIDLQEHMYAANAVSLVLVLFLEPGSIFTLVLYKKREPVSRFSSFYLRIISKSCRYP